PGLPPAAGGSQGPAGTVGGGPQAGWTVSREDGGTPSAPAGRRAHAAARPRRRAALRTVEHYHSRRPVGERGAGPQSGRPGRPSQRARRAAAARTGASRGRNGSIGSGRAGVRFIAALSRAGCPAADTGFTPPALILCCRCASYTKLWHTN